MLYWYQKLLTADFKKKQLYCISKFRQLGKKCDSYLLFEMIYPNFQIFDEKW